MLAFVIAFQWLQQCANQILMSENAKNESNVVQNSAFVVLRRF